MQKSGNFESNLGIMNQLIKSVVLLLLLVTVCHSGPLAAGSWSAICAHCVSTCLATGGFYPVCVASCCVGGSLFSSLFGCFDEDTTVITLKG